jgi:NhaP-type Na+/H+ or K+/H+ antiporter
MDLDSALQATAVIAASGALAQIIGRRLKFPVPVILLATGVAVGRDGLGLVNPAEINELVSVAIKIAVALIVFEGGMAISLTTLRQLAPVVRNIVVGGLLFTPVVGAVASHYFLDFPWRVAALFGALVCVTGPSVITPLLRQVKVNERLRAILMGEGVIIDPFGALLTLFLLQIALAPSFDPAGPTRWVIVRVLVGVLVGGAGALVVAILPRIVKRLSSREISLLAVGAGVATFAIAESLRTEAGLTSMVVMGIALGNISIPHREALDDFQESIAAFLVATVYVLLAASVRLSSLADLWPNGIFVVLVLMFVGRPLLVIMASWRSDLSARERAFLALVGPRGVVAASLAGVVALDVAASLGASKDAFVATVFVVIATTITVQSLYAGPLSRFLKVMPRKTVIAGAGDVGRRLARRLKEAGETVLIIESDEDTAVQAREEGFEVFLGDIGKAEVLSKAGVGDAHAFLLTTTNDDRNLLGAQLARSSLGVQRIYARVNETANIGAFRDLGIGVVSPQEAVAAELADLIGASPLADIVSPVDADVEVVRLTVTNSDAQRPIQALTALRGTVVIMVRRGKTSVVPSGKTTLRLGDVLTLIGHQREIAIARASLTVESAALAGARE